jgi:hypothetical protein
MKRDLNLFALRFTDLPYQITKLPESFPDLSYKSLIHWNTLIGAELLAVPLEELYCWLKQGPASTDATVYPRGLSAQKAIRRGTGSPLVILAT